MINGKIDGQDAYFTNDLLEPHPTFPEYWKVYGRSDDQIMHNTGEKVYYISFSSTSAGRMLTPWIPDKPRSARYVHDDLNSSDLVLRLIVSHDGQKV